MSRAPFDPDAGRDWCARTPAESVEADEIAVSRLVRWVEWDTVCLRCLGPIREDGVGCARGDCRHFRNLTTTTRAVPKEAA